MTCSEASSPFLNVICFAIVNRFMYMLYHNGTFTAQARQTFSSQSSETLLLNRGLFLLRLLDKSNICLPITFAFIDLQLMPSWGTVVTWFMR